MNFLAHLFLSCDEVPLIIGNFIADAISNRELPDYPPDIRKGIRLHRKIDTYTDRHPDFLACARKLYKAHGKYAPVILDVLYDYILIQNWEKYSEEEISIFVNRMYRILTDNSTLMPPVLQQRLPRMIDNNWLMQYGTKKGLEFAFSKMKSRVSYPHYFDNIITSLESYYPFLEAKFNSFFPDLIQYVEQECHRGD